MSREDRLEILLFKVVAANGYCQFSKQKNLLVGRSLSREQIESDLSTVEDLVHVFEAKGLDSLCEEIEKEIRK